MIPDCTEAKDFIENASESDKPSVDQDCLEAIYSYWKEARYSLNKGHSLRPVLKVSCVVNV